MSMFDRGEPIEVPHLLRDVKDPCTEQYYPEWSSRGMRAVRCTRPAKATATIGGQILRKCGIHGKTWQRAGYPVVWDGAK